MFFQGLQRKISLIILLFGGFQLLFGQQKIALKQISIEQGLPGVNIRCGYQDSKGIIWLGVESVGLCRYDGHDFVVYEHNPDDPHSISNNFSQEIVEGDSGKLWIATLHGLNKFDRKNKRFTNYAHIANEKYSLANNQVLALTKDKFGNLWLGTHHGVSKFNPKRKEFVNVLNQYKYSLLNLTVHKIVEDEHGDIWITSREAGFFKIDASTNLQHTKEWEARPARELNTELKISGHWCIENSLNKGLNTNSINEIVYAGNSKFWVGTYNGIYIYDKKKDVFEKFRFNKPVADRIKGAGYEAMLIDSNGKLWAGSISNGLVIIDTATRDFQYLNADVFDAKGLKSNSIRSIIEDKSGLIWVLTKFQGIHIYDKRQEMFSLIGEQDKMSGGLSDKYVLSVAEDSLKNIWIGTKLAGLNKLNPKTGEIQTFLNGNRNNYNRIESILDINNEYLLLGTAGGVSKFNKVTGSFYNVESPYIRSLARDKNGQIWVGTNFEGVYIYDLGDNTLKPYLKTKYKKLLESLSTLGLYIDRSNNLWIVTFEEGLYKYSIPTDEIIHYFSDAMDSTSISGNMIRSFFKDDDGLVYIGTKSDGLNILDPNTELIQRLSKKDGMPSNSVYSIEKDHEGYFWFGTQDGLVKYDPGKGTFINFSELYGLQGKVFEINAHCFTADHTMYFGGSNGLNYFTPSNVTKSNYRAPIVISSLKVYNEVIGADINTNQSYKLDSKDKYITIDFALLDYSDPKKNMYMYKMERFDSDWIECGNRHYATYTNLPVGEYTFIVKAANADNIWNKEGLSIDLIIEAPFYSKSWFFVAVGVLIAFMIVLGYFLLIEPIRKNEKLLTSIVDQKTADLSKAYEKIEQQKSEIEKHNTDPLKKQENLSRQNQEQAGIHLKLEEFVQERTKDLELAKQRAVESDLLKSAFLANISHENRIPLNAIVGFSEILANNEYQEDELEQINSVIRQSSHSLLQMAMDIIDISKIESNQIKLINRSFCIGGLLENIYATYAKIISQHEEKKHIELQLNVPPQYKELSILSDSSRIEQIFFNLLNNALKFTKDGFIEIGSNIESPQKIRFYVKDTGIGISNEYKKMIFDRFKKVEDNKIQLIGGTGLGLAISSSLVKLLGGKIWVETEINKGSVFYFELPLLEGINKEVEFTEKAVASTNPPDWSSKHILIVEDEESNFKVLCTILRKTKVNIKHVRDGEEAVNLFKTGNETNFDLILMDIKLPLMSGMEATAKIKKQYPEIPIIAQTAYAMNNEKIEIMQVGFNDYISKPIITEELIEKMGRFI